MSPIPFFLAAALDLDPWELVRVEVADHAEAEASSDQGSVLLAPPTDGTPYRWEPVPELDEVEAWEAIEALDASPWHEAGYDGSGVKVAVFDVQWYGAELRDLGIWDELSPAATLDCWSHQSCEVPMDTLRPRFSWELGSHGVACAEIIRDLAPGVELYLVRVNGQTTLENAVAWALREGVDLVSMSMSFFNESFYDGTGSINDLMDELDAGDTLMVTSSGNYAQEHWLQRFEDADGDDLHDFYGGSGGLAIYLDEGVSRLNLNWDQYWRCGDTDLDAYVYNAEGNLVGRSTGSQASGQEGCLPAERVRVNAAEAGWHRLQVHRAGGSSATTFRIFARGATVYQAMAEGSITDPGTHPSVLTVGAIRARGYLDNGVEAFSSQGPTWTGLQKPELAGPNGLSTTVYGPTGFYGTSASTPAVTAAIALVMSRDPTLSPREAAQLLVDAAWTEAPVWEAFDPALGAGHARLPPPKGEVGGCGRVPLLALGLPLLPGLCRRRRHAAKVRPKSQGPQAPGKPAKP